MPETLLTALKKPKSTSTATDSQRLKNINVEKRFPCKSAGEPRRLRRSDGAPKLKSIFWTSVDPTNVADTLWEPESKKQEKAKDGSYRENRDSVTIDPAAIEAMFVATDSSRKFGGGGGGESSRNMKIH